MKEIFVQNAKKNMKELMEHALSEIAMIGQTINAFPASLDSKILKVYA